MRNKLLLLALTAVMLMGISVPATADVLHLYYEGELPDGRYYGFFEDPYIHYPDLLNEGFSHIFYGEISYDTFTFGGDTYTPVYGSASIYADDPGIFYLEYSYGFTLTTPFVEEELSVGLAFSVYNSIGGFQQYFQIPSSNLSFGYPQILFDFEGTPRKTDLPDTVLFTCFEKSNPYQFKIIPDAVVFDFGDGSDTVTINADSFSWPGLGASVSHYYASEGLYTVTSYWSFFDGSVSYEVKKTDYIIVGNPAYPAPGDGSNGWWNKWIWFRGTGGH